MALSSDLSVWIRAATLSGPWVAGPGTGRCSRSVVCGESCRLFRALGQTILVDWIRPENEEGQHAGGGD